MDRNKVIEALRQAPDGDVRWALIEAAWGGVSVPFIDGSPKPERIKPKQPSHLDNKVNPLWLVELRDLELDYARQWFNYYGHQHQTLDKQLKQIAAMAAEAGIDLDQYAPHTPSVFEISRVEQIFELGEKQIDEMIARIEDSHETGMRMVDDAKKKSWVRVLRKLKDLQHLCRQENPRNYKGKKREAWTLLHPVRYMIYTMRTDMNLEGETPGIVSMPNHIIMIHLCVELGRKYRRELAGEGPRGVMVKIPPRHGKTYAVSANMALRHVKRPDLAIGYVHNNLDIAKQRLGMVMQHFDPETGTGLRRRALFRWPELDRRTIHPKSGVERMILRVEDDRPCIQQEGNGACYGIHNKRQGVTCHELSIDDPIDEKDARESGTRERTADALDKTWMKRLTGKYSFWILINTSWHPDDYSERLKKRIQQGILRAGMYIQSCGGPEDNFQPIWPEAGFDRTFLRAEYKRDAADYCVVYMNTPDTEHSRRISRLVYYDYDKVIASPHVRSPEWVRYFNDPETQYYLTCDPSGTESKDSNLAGLMYFAFGNLRRNLHVLGGMMDIPTIVFIKFWSFPASQHTMSQTIADWMKGTQTQEPQPVDYVLVETTSGYHATADNLIEMHGISEEKILRRNPGTGTKQARLQKYAIHLENGSAMFPGAWQKVGDQLQLQVREDWMDCQSQLLRAGEMKDSNLLDCVRQALAEMAPKLFRFSFDGEDAIGLSVTPMDRMQIRKQKMFQDAKKKAKGKRLNRVGRGVSFTKQLQRQGWIQ